MRVSILSVGVPVLVLVLASTGCEQGGVADDAPSAEQTMAPPKANDPAPVAAQPDSGAATGSRGPSERRSALGKAHQHAENVVDKAQEEQQKLIEQMTEDDGG